MSKTINQKKKKNLKHEIIKILESIRYFVMSEQGK